jgi:thiol-disulfide isomerase/thioredoxin
MNVFNFVIAFFLISNIYGQGIEFFEGSWDEALIKAKNEDKVIFIDCYTTWCGPCKSMAKNTFTDPKVGEFFNATFINMKLDMEKPEGRKFEGKYPVSAYPTLYFVDGEVVKKSVGGQRPDGLMTLGKEASKGLDKSMQFEELYLKGDRSYDLVLKYVKSLNNNGKGGQKVANSYLDSNPEISQEQKLKFIFEAAFEADSKIFEAMLENKLEITKLVGEKAYTEKVASACKKTVNKAIEFETETLLTEAIDKAKIGLIGKSQTTFVCTSQMEYYKAFGDKVAYMKAANALANHASKDDKSQLVFVVEDICKNYPSDVKMTKKASEYAKELYKSDQSMENLNLYCKALLSSKQYDKALNAAHDALNAAKKGKDDKNVPAIEGMINYINNQKQKAS